MTEKEPLIAVVASPDEKAKNLLVSLLPEVEIIPVSKIGALLSLLADVPVDMLFIDDEFDERRTYDLLPTIRDLAPELVVWIMPSEARMTGTPLSDNVFGIFPSTLEPAEARERIRKGIEHVRLLHQVRLMEEKKQRLEKAAHAPSPTVEPVNQGGAHGALKQFIGASINLEDIGNLSDMLLDSVAEYYMATKAALFLFDEETNTLQLSGCRGMDDELLKVIPFSPHSGIFHWARKTNRVLQISKLPELPMGESLLVIEKEAKLLHAEVILPLLGKRQIVGFLSLGNKFSGALYAGEEMKCMFFTARHAGAVLENALLLHKTRGMAIRDELTQLYNRNYWKKNLEIEVERSRRYQRPLSVAIFDIDYFKKINDAFGHPFGDQVLKELARYLMKSSRNIDIVGRYGGEEFIAILPETSAEFALTYCERLRQDVETKLGSRESKECIHPGLTISGGMTTCDSRDDSVAQIIERADKALYRAKKEGRNQIQQFPS